ncbi:uracil-DNA glycosylase family protein [Teredinibacter sp. KSP-S5-2]|uniref:uracil-DNA glycosylase family protein n=1 Tax=Teredinibacter sp. KSP-S5-2 TaxID=3034506 RepID=UPI0029353339|nr:uracil-DNA glycosylase family protein [Teredinibacter sp. KSP-S5-2]WNO09487.1 uracil-DNA glycosylase family protein [Teredinibacter sp. KSP-S5-2]
MSERKLNQLIQEIKSCTHCAEHLPFAPRPVLIANPEARILLIGQAPGTKVHASGIPWDDPSGKRLRQWLQLNDQDFYDPTQLAIMPMGFCYPGKGKSGDLPPRPECAPLWHKQVLQYLPNIQLTLLVGQYAQNYYLGKDKSTLSQRVQNWFNNYKNKNSAQPIIPLPHPSPRNTLWLKKNSWFEEDCLKILQMLVKKALI